MIKVLLIITTMSGISHQVGFENMQECLESRNVIMAQSTRVEEAVCLPTGDNKYQEQQINHFFDKLLEFVNKTKNIGK